MRALARAGRVSACRRSQCAMRRWMAATGAYIGPSCFLSWPGASLKPLSSTIMRTLSGQRSLIKSTVAAPMEKPCSRTWMSSPNLWRRKSSQSRQSSLSKTPKPI